MQCELCVWVKCNRRQSAYNNYNAAYLIALTQSIAGLAISHCIQTVFIVLLPSELLSQVTIQLNPVKYSSSFTLVPGKTRVHSNRKLVSLIGWRLIGSIIAGWFVLFPLSLMIHRCRYHGVRRNDFAYECRLVLGAVVLRFRTVISRTIS